MRHVSAIKISDSVNLNAGRRFCRFQELSFDLLECVFNALRSLGFYFHSPRRLWVENRDFKLPPSWKMQTIRGWKLIDVK